MDFNEVGRGFIFQLDNYVFNFFILKQEKNLKISFVCGMILIIRVVERYIFLLRKVFYVKVVSVYMIIWYN